MEFVPFRLIRKTELNKLKEDRASQHLQIATAANFIQEIEKGNLEADYYGGENLPADQEDQLANLLLGLREQMVRVSVEEKQRNWSTETKSRFIDILRSRNNDLTELADDIIRHLVKCLSANQGGLYLVNDDDPADMYIELLACYAYGSKKFITRRIKPGQGLVGQTMLEKKPLYITTLPATYLKITSGLGEALPRHLLIVPLMLEGKVFGAIEIASFQDLPEYEREFVEQVGESIASTVAYVKNSQRTQLLLEETQQQTEEVRAQEEEMRQNMEELSATQEEMKRVMSEMSEQLRLINATVATVEFDMNGVIREANGNFLKLMGYEKSEVIGQHHQIFVPRRDRRSSAYAEFWQNLGKGKSFDGEFKRVTKDKRAVWIRGIYAPVLNEEGQTIKIMKFAYDITKEKEQHEARVRITCEMSEQLRLINTTLLTIEFDLTGVIREVNDNFLQLMEYQHSEVVGQHHHLLLEEEERQSPASEEFWQTLVMGRSFEGEFKRVTKEGKTVWIRGIYTPVLNENGRTTKVTKFAYDVTKEKEQEEALRRQAEALETMKADLRSIQEKMVQVLDNASGAERDMSELLSLARDAIYTLDHQGRSLTFDQNSSPLHIE